MAEEMSRKDIILTQIEVQFKSIANFSRATGIPDGTIRNIKTRPDESIDNMAVGLFVKICKALHLDAEELIEGRFSIRPNEQQRAILQAYKESPIDLAHLTEEHLQILSLVDAMPPQQRKSLVAFLQGQAGSSP